MRYDNISGITNQNSSFYSHILNNVEKGALIIDQKGKIILGNSQVSQMLGYSLNELTSMNIITITIEMNNDKWIEHWNKLKIEKSFVWKAMSTTKNGSILQVDLETNLVTFNNNEVELTFINSISDKKKTDNANELYLEFLSKLDRINDVIQQTTNIDQMLDNVLHETLAIFECDRALLIHEIDFTKGLWNIPKMQFKKEFPTPEPSEMDDEELKSFQSKASKIFQDIIKVNNEVKIYTESKKDFDFDFFDKLHVKSTIAIPIFPKVGKPWIFSLHQCSFERTWTDEEILVFEQIRRRISDSLSTFLYYKDLQESEIKFRTIIETASEGVILLDKDRKTIFVNKTLTEMLGYTENEMLNRSADEFVIKEELEDHLDKVRSRQNLISDNFDRRLKCKDGSIIWTTISGAPLLNGGKEYVGSFAMISNISERKKNEQEILNLNRVYLTLVACNEALVQVNDEKELLNKICNIIVDKGGYRLVWVGYAVNDEEKTVDKVAFAGHAKEYLENIKVTWDDGKYGRGPTGTAIKTGEVFTLNKINDESFGPWKLQADKFGFESCTAFPLTIDSKSFGSINIYSGIEHFFTESELSLLEDLANNLSYGIKSIRLNEEREKLLSMLNEAQRIAHIGNWEFFINDNNFIMSYEIYRIFEIQSNDTNLMFDEYLRRIHPEDRIMVENSFNSSFKNHQPFSLDHKLLVNNSKIKYIHLECENYYDEHNNSFRFVGTMQDITDIKIAEEERLAHLQFIESLDIINKSMKTSGSFDELLNRVLDEIIVIFDCDKTSLSFPCDPTSKTWKLVAERHKNEYPTLSVIDLDYPMTEKVGLMLQILLDTEKPVQFGPDNTSNLPSQVADQFRLESFLSLAIKPKIGKPWLLGISQVSSKRIWTIKEEELFEEIGRRMEDWLSTLLFHQNLQESEERYRMVFENSSVPILEVDFSAIKNNLNELVDKGESDIITYLSENKEYAKKCLQEIRIIDVNNATLDLFESEEKENFISNFSKIIDFEYSELFQKVLVNLYKGYLQMTNNTVIKTFKGNLKYTTIFFSVCQGHEESLSRIIISITDITELKQSQDEVQRLNQNLELRVLERTNQLKRLNKELEAFSYSVSHDLRVPLNHIKGYLELLEENDTTTRLNDEEKLFFSKISKLTAQMSQIIEGILSFSKIDYEQLILTSVDLNILVKSVIQDFQPETKGRLVTWNIDNLPVIKVDENLFRLVIVNLLSNALKFTRKESEAKITIGYTPTQSEHTIFIRDNGVGFDMKNVKKLFNVFERLHTNDEFEGTGIGLSNVQRIITRHGGKIWAESTLGNGATFYFSIPKKI